MSTASAARPRLIINADDLGADPCVNQAIRSAYERGILTSASMVLTLAGLEDAIENVIRPTGLPVGLHLSLTWGRCRAAPAAIPLLVDEQGVFRRTAAYLFRHLRRPNHEPALATQVHTELGAQLRYAHSLGLTYTHFDTHQHVGAVPAVAAILEELAPAFGLTKCRRAREAFDWGVFVDRPTQVLQRRNLLKWGLTQYHAARSRGALRSPDRFIGLLYSGIMTRRTVTRIVRRLRTPYAYELAVHPAFPSPGTGAGLFTPQVVKFFASPDRQREHDLLVDPELCALTREVADLISYADL